MEYELPQVTFSWGVKAAVVAVDTTDATEAEKQALKDIADKAAEPEMAIEDASAALEELNKVAEPNSPQIGDHKYVHLDCSFLHQWRCVIHFDCF